MEKRVWLSRRAIKLHVVILIVVPGFLALCLWQVDRALGGNSLSWAYVFEWPLFAGYAVYMWWRFVHEAADDSSASTASASTASAGTAPGDTTAAAAGTTPETEMQETPQELEEDKEMAAYNQYLAQLAERDKASGR